MGKFLDHVVIGLAWVLVIAAGAYFGGPRIWAHIQEGEAAKVTARAQAGALDADRIAANRAQQSCSDAIARTQKADAAIAKAAQPQPVVAGQPRPMIGADQVRSMIQ